MTYARITGTGSYLPARTMTNAELEALLVEYDEQEDVYTVRLTRGRLPAVTISPDYKKLASEAKDAKTRDFVSSNLRSARWLIDALRQRNATLLRVIKVVLEAQREFFEQGPEGLRPLPMTQVADQLGIHVATVSRAVNEKYLQTPRGIFPLRMFFSGGTETEGNSIFIFEMAGLCIGHLGHLHHEPNAEQYAAIGRLDVVMAAVDGGLTVDLPTMIRLLKRLRSSIVIPMHWFGEGNLARFLEGMEQDFQVVHVPGASIEVSLDRLPSRPTVMVLRPQWLRDVE